jgi:CoA:oxalate CoA-transferase
LSRDKGREILFRLVKQSDVFVLNFRKGVADELGITYETLSKINPRIIYASVSPWGPNGPDSGQAGYDYLGQARSGFMSTMGEPGAPPGIAPGSIADCMTGTVLAYGILAAIIARERTGKGQKVDASLLGSMMWLQYLSVSTSLMVGWAIPPQSRASCWNPILNHYLCADNQWIALGLLQSDRYWPAFCKAIGLEELEKDVKFENQLVRAVNCRELIAILDKVFARKTSDEWMLILKEVDLLFSRVNAVPDLHSDPQVLANDYIIECQHNALGKIRMVGMPVGLNQTPGLVKRSAPEFGEHTEEVLLELGYSWEEISHFREEGTI